MAKVMQFHQVLNVDPKPNLPVRQKDAEQLDCVDARNKSAVKAMNRNDHALSNLAVAFTTVKAMVLHKAGSTEWPDGLASDVVKSLMQKYRTQDLISRIEYDNTLRSFKLKKTKILQNCLTISLKPTRNTE
jgi:hypothetical protein